MTVIGLHGQGGPNVALIVVEAISHGLEHVTTRHPKMVAIIVAWMEVYQQNKDHAIEKDVTLINQGISNQEIVFVRNQYLELTFFFLKIFHCFNVLLYRKDESKTDLFSGRVRLQNIIKNKRIPPSQIMKQSIAKIKKNDQISVDLDKYFPKMSKSKEITVCNGTIIPPTIKGFIGPLNNMELQRLISSNGYSSSETYMGWNVDTSRINRKYVYYLCDDRKVLSTKTNQRFFRLPCNSSKFEPGITGTKYPTCYDPTHCIGVPKIR